MPGEVVEEEVDGEVAFPGPEVPGWDRSVTAVGVLHDQVILDQVLPRGAGRAQHGTLVLRHALPLEIPAAITSL